MYSSAHNARDVRALPSPSDASECGAAEAGDHAGGTQRETDECRGDRLGCHDHPASGLRGERDRQGAVLGFAGEHEDPDDGGQHGHQRQWVDEQLGGPQSRVGVRRREDGGDEGTDNAGEDEDHLVGSEGGQFDPLASQRSGYCSRIVGAGADR